MAIYLREEEVRSLIRMPEVLEAVESVMSEHARGDALDTPRERTRLPVGVMLHMLQGAVPSAGVLGFKSYTSSREGVRFWVHLFDAANGAPLAVLEADWLGMMRTGAAGALGAKWLARQDVRTAGVFGAGWQAQSQIEALCLVRPVETIRVYSRHAEKLAAFCAEMSQRTGRQVIPAASPEETVRGAEVLVTITTASRPLFEADWLEAGCHVTGAGSNALIRQELSEAAVKRASLIAVDSRAVAQKESGDLFPLIEKGRLNPGKLVELGDIINGLHAGRGASQDITLFESQGMAVQDLAVAARVLEAARAAGVGTQLPY
ncbi:MAG: ornithine cyclodeaminase family protein [Zoogloea sp.]|nr:ornithine cyclodeaminase family protein [Zoogloea sp.]